MERLVVVGLLFVAWPVAAEVTVTAAGERVSIRAVAAPLEQVLDQMALKTGMKVVYEGSHPRQPVTLTLESRTPAEAVLALLQGQGLNFGLRTDATGVNVERLLLAGLAPVASSSPQAAPASKPSFPMARGPVPVPEPEEDLKDTEHEQAAPRRAPKPPQGQTPQGPAVAPAPNYPRSPFAPKPNEPAPPAPENDMP